MRRHVCEQQNFTRDRKLNFQKVILTVFRKSTKSLQLVLNELSDHIPSLTKVTAGAYSRARHKFSHTAFVELSQECLVKPFLCRRMCKETQRLSGTSD